MAKSVLYFYNPTVGTIADGGSIPIQTGNIVRRYGCDCTVNDNTILCKNGGYFDVDVALTVTAGGTTATTAALYQDGTLIPGTAVTLTPTAAGTTLYFNLPRSVIRVRGCCCAESRLTVRLTGGTATAGTVSGVVEKV